MIPTVCTFKIYKREEKTINVHNFTLTLTEKPIIRAKIALRFTEQLLRLFLFESLYAPLKTIKVIIIVDCG